MSDKQKDPRVCEYFTLVFKGDIRKMPNPFTTDTLFGRAIASGIGDAFNELDRVKDGLEDAIETLEAMDLHIDNPLYDRLRAILEQNQ